jgi:integrase
MANEKSIFKYIICPTPGCGYKKTDITGKVGEVDKKGKPTKDSTPAISCKNCNTPMYLSENWYARITHNGKTTVKSISPRHRDAEDYISTCNVAKRTNSLMPGEENDVKWADAVKDAKKWWDDAVTKKDIRQSTADFYSFNLVALESYFSDMSLLTIRKADLLDYQTYRSKQNISPTTINHERTTLLRIYSLHLDRTSSDESPKMFAKHQDLKRVKKLEESTEKVRFLTADEAKALIKACTPTVRLAVLIGLNTGLRKQNVLDLKWKEHVDLKNRLIKLPGTMMKNKDPHTVDIPHQLAVELKAWRDAQKLSSFVFPELAGDDPAETIRVDFEKAVKAAELTDVTFHTLRHTFASQWLMSGGDLVTLSEVLAHSSIQITKDLYGHLSRDHKRKAHDEFASAFLDQLA